MRRVGVVGCVRAEKPLHERDAKTVKAISENIRENLPTPE